MSDRYGIITKQRLKQISGSELISQVRAGSSQATGTVEVGPLIASTQKMKEEVISLCVAPNLGQLEEISTRLWLMVDVVMNLISDHSPLTAQEASEILLMKGKSISK